MTTLPDLYLGGGAEMIGASEGPGDSLPSELTAAIFAAASGSL
jgi:hypothetical protein